jgi:hypothetical protein
MNMSAWVCGCFVEWLINHSLFYVFYFTFYVKNDARADLDIRPRQSKRLKSIGKLILTPNSENQVEFYKFLKKLIRQYSNHIVIDRDKATLAVKFLGFILLN